MTTLWGLELVCLLPRLRAELVNMNSIYERGDWGGVGVHLSREVFQALREATFRSKEGLECLGGTAGKICVTWGAVQVLPKDGLEHLPPGPVMLVPLLRKDEYLDRRAAA